MDTGQTDESPDLDAYKTCPEGSPGTVETEQSFHTDGMGRVGALVCTWSLDSLDPVDPWNPSAETWKHLRIKKL